MIKTPPAKSPLRVGLISLGCAKNLVDSEIMLGSLVGGGMEITNDPASADAVIVNTCSFIDSAQAESVDTILESVALRDANRRGQAVIVSGCLPQRFREELPKLLPEVDAFMGIDQVAQVAEIVERALQHRSTKTGSPAPVAGKSIAGKKSRTKIHNRLATLDASSGHEAHDHESSLRGTSRFGKTKTFVTPAAPLAPVLDVTARPVFIPDVNTPRFRLTPSHFAYLKIAEGCNHPCSFCIIPRMRGAHRSRSQKDIVAEARALIVDGVKEINLISQDSTYYGLDLRPGHTPAIASPARFSAAAQALAADATTICTLLRALNELPGDFWIRLLYTHPAHWTDELIQTIAECPKVARYIDIPLQHIHENMLERMRRETSPEYIIDLLRKIRAGIPGIALRTTFIVGFPGETAASFDTLLDFIRTTRFERLGVFAYSREDGTRAGSMAGQIPAATRKSRRARAMAVQHEIAVRIAESFVGREIKVLVEGHASTQQLSSAKISSWEHRLLRSRADTKASPAGKAYLIGRGEADAPDIDGRVFVRGNLPVGRFARVKVIGHTDYDLIAEPV